MHYALQRYRLPLFLLLLLTTITPCQALDVRVNDSRENNFYMDALAWLLKKSGVDHRLIHTDHPPSTQQDKVEMVKNGEIDVMYAGTTNALEQQLQAIRFPITRGYIGTRLLLINKHHQRDYDQINQLDDLKAHTAAFGYGWADVEIFRASDLPVEEALYEEIFNLINEGGDYYFSRGVLEIYSELIDKRQSHKDLTVEKQLLLKFKSAVFFFINPANNELKSALEHGFRNGYADGSYIEFFYNHPLIRTSFKKLNLKNRRLIEIPNPYFPKASEDIPAEYWHHK